MRAFIWVSLVYFVVGYLATLIAAATQKYPRIAVYSKGNDTVRVLIFCAFVSWALVLLF